MIFSSVFAISIFLNIFLYMKIKKGFLFQLLFVLSFAACKNDAAETASSKNSDEKIPVIIIDLQPFSDIPKENVDNVYAELKKIYSNVTIKKAIPLPQTAYYEKRNRYKADTIISYLRKQTSDGHITMGLTSKDISHKKGNIEDYGLMGLAYQPGKSGVVSYFRLSKENRLEQFFKLTIHELGHTQGLPHCPEKTCFMRDAEGKNHTNEEKEFCTKCKAHLESKGWKFN